jgi:tRNA dimethylallyltransferase
MATPVDSNMNTKSVQVNKINNRGGSLPLIVIVGPTASGKSATAMRIAKEFDGEIICADSRTIYKHLDIGTAKPSVEDQAEVPHWGLDLVEPGEVFTAADFKNYAQKKIDEIRKRGRLPMVVGGTGLYIDGLILDYQFGDPQPELRKILQSMSLDELKEYCFNNNITLPENDQNPRYIIRAIEQKNINAKRLTEPKADTLVVGITTERDELRRRIAERSEHMFENGMVEEAKKLGKKYGWNSEAMTGNVYPLVKQFLDGELSETELKDKFITADWRLAKRQMTWLKRNQFIHWKSLDDAYLFIKKQLTLAKQPE